MTTGGNKSRNSNSNNTQGEDFGMTRWTEEEEEGSVRVTIGLIWAAGRDTLIGAVMVVNDGNSLVGKCRDSVLVQNCLS